MPELTVLTVSKETGLTPNRNITPCYSGSDGVDETAEDRVDLQSTSSKRRRRRTTPHPASVMNFRPPVEDANLQVGL